MINVSIQSAAILASLEREPLSGVDLLDEFARRTRSRLPLGPLYTTLNRLIDRGLVAVIATVPTRSLSGGASRRINSLTAAGLVALAEHRDAIRLAAGDPPLIPT